MDWKVLGPVEVVDDGGETTPLGGPKQRSVLALLLTNLGRSVTTDELVEELWPETLPDTDRKTMQTYVARIRRALADAGASDCLRSTGSGYRLELDESAVDSKRFESLVTRAKHLIGVNPEDAAALLVEALSLWRGRPFEDAHPTPSLDLETTRLEEMRLVAQETLAEARLRSERASSVIPELQLMVAAHPLREHLWALLVLALYQSGRQSEALRTAMQVRTRLGEELGVEPGPELQDLEQAILDHDPALDPPRLKGTERIRGSSRMAVSSVVVLAVAAIIGFGSWRLLAHSEDGPAVGERHLAPPGSAAAVAAGGSIWVMVPESSELVSLNPHTGETYGVILAHRPSAITAGLGSVWVASEDAGRLIRVNASSGEVEAESPPIELKGADLAVSKDAVWVVREHQFSFLMVDPVDLTPTTPDFTSTIPPDGPSVAIDDGAVWATNSDLGTVLWFDPVSGEFDIVGDARLGNHAARSITVSRGSVWFSQPTNGSITRLDEASAEVTAIVEVGKKTGSGFPQLRRPYELTVGPGGLWAALPEDGKVVMIDEANEELTATVVLGEPTSIFPLAGSVWVLDRQLTQLVRIDPKTCESLPFIGPGADLRGCDLTDAVLVDVDLSSADFRWARVGLVPMQNSNLAGADLRGTDFTNAILDGVTWDGTRCPDGSSSDDNGGTCLGHLAP